MNELLLDPTFLLIYCHLEYQYYTRRSLMFWRPSRNGSTAPRLPVEVVCSISVAEQDIQDFDPWERYAVF